MERSPRKKTKFGSKLFGCFWGAKKKDVTKIMSNIIPESQNVSKTPENTSKTQSAPDTGESTPNTPMQTPNVVGHSSNSHQSSRRNSGGHQMISPDHSLRIDEPSEVNPHIDPPRSSYEIRREEAQYQLQFISEDLQRRSEMFSDENSNSCIIL
ncbi:hypothetical protein RJT34_01778 [Clitoria ternatea]|uniref:Uncharacterized protein n=1 Tax=Clitoria ternatea TaxID=43366 RepID=A0AAN9Q3H9_CLITE